VTMLRCVSLFALSHWLLSCNIFCCEKVRVSNALLSTSATCIERGQDAICLYSPSAVWFPSASQRCKQQQQHRHARLVLASSHHTMAFTQTINAAAAASTAEPASSIDANLAVSPLSSIILYRGLARDAMRICELSEQRHDAATATGLGRGQSGTSPSTTSSSCNDTTSRSALSSLAVCS
jgi:hypothetical protein